MWKRWFATACLLLVAMVGTAQATHIHGDWLPRADHALQAPALDAQSLGGEEHCPLCVAAHSTLPVSIHLEPFVPGLTETPLPEHVEVVRETHWHFAMFSRPPPSIPVA